MKKKYLIMLCVLLAAGIGFLLFAVQHPEMSFPWNHRITNVIYGFYAALVVLLTILSFRKEKFMGMEKMVLLLEIGSIFFLVESLLNKPSNWYLPTALLLNCIALFLIRHLQKKKQKEKEQEKLK